MKCAMLIIYRKLVRAAYYIHRAHLLVQNKMMRWMMLVMLGDRATMVYKVQYTCQ